MYTGTLIDELMDTVERVEKHAIAEHSRKENLDYWYAIAQNELTRFESALAGVA